ncbi:hypothetical protein EST38_g7506 [Candolleomyces aberdarensis]|uniref:F-box domain-containing protein n=1 Tax=Candolleomyces aberdarensis TaxID=2316362 RepID=A0A4V1Q3E8_9AGAR|nr:hypothetical protein EST38_g7506 [Candolleomyces aberdarensis]
MMAPESIPEDIIANVLSYLKDDIRTLKSCALVSRSVHIHAYKLIFSILDLRWSHRIQRLNENPRQRLNNILQLIHRKPYLKDAVKKLCLRVVLKNTDDLSPVWMFLPMLLQQPLPNLTSLTVTTSTEVEAQPKLVVNGTLQHAYKSQLQSILIDSLWPFWFVRAI